MTDSARSTPLDESAVSRAIVSAFGGVDVVTTNGNSFFFYDPGRDTPPDHRFPFATLVTSDEYDQFSDLSRPGVYRLNVGVSGETFRALFPDRFSEPAAPAESVPDAPDSDATPTGDSTYDFTALDQILPHPVYGRMHWVCVLNPSPATFARIQPLLAEGYELAARRHAGQRPAS